jgi:hypothetical protein
MTDLEDFLPKILPFAPGCPEPTAFEHLRNAAQDFCEETRLWRFDDTFTFGDDPNIVCAPQGSVIHEFERCDYNGYKLEPRSLDWLDDHYPDWRSDTNAEPGDPVWFTQICLDTVRLVPAPSLVDPDNPPGTVHVWLRLKPSDDCDQLPDFLASQYSNLISWGALANILMLPNQTFSNPNMAAYFQGKFDQGIGRKSKMQSIGQQRAPIRTKANFF